MRLRSVKIEAYRSLYDVTLRPATFRALVGPNNAGKTNLADAIQFVGEIARHGLELAVGRQGGFEHFAFRRQRRTRRPVSFSFLAEVTNADIAEYRPIPRRRVQAGRYTVTCDYSFSLRASSESRDADYRVASEHMELCLNGKPVLILERADTKLSHTLVETGGTSPRFGDILDPFQDDVYWEFLQRRLEPTELVLTSMRFNTVIDAVLTALGRTRLFQLTPLESRRPSASTPNPELGLHGANLPAVVRYMRGNHPTAWDATMVAMRDIMPGLAGIRTEFTADRELTLIFEESGTKGWTANEVSDGTIQSLALFLCLFDPRVPLVMIEEPENSVHPWIVKTFVDACRRVTEKQVFVTTHSPALIAYLKPEELDVMWRDDSGQSHLDSLETLDPEARRLWSDGVVDLFQVIDGGTIPHALPSGFQ